MLGTFSLCVFVSLAAAIDYAQHVDAVTLSGLSYSRERCKVLVPLHALKHTFPYARFACCQP